MRAGYMAGIAIALLMVVAGCIAETAMVSPVGTPQPTAAVFLPAVNQPCPCTCVPPTPTPTPPPVVTVEIVDCGGQITSTWWLTSTFGDVRWSEGNLSRLQCSIGPSVVVVHIVDINGQPVQGATAVFYYSTGPFLPIDLQNCGLDRGVYGPTDEFGDIGFAIGSGSYYEPPSGGPHVLWTVPGASCLAGIGMLAFSEHQTLWPTFVAEPGDLGYSPQAVLERMTVMGREMWVVQVP